MALNLADRVRETSTTTGTGSYVLSGGSVSGFRTFISAIGLDQHCTYVATMGSQWEVGVGLVTGATGLSRHLILASSNSGNAVNWSAGTKEIRCDVAGATAMTMYQGAVRWGGTTGGTASALTITLSPPIYSYWPGLTIAALTHTFLTSASPTLDVNGIGASNLRRLNGATLNTNYFGSNALLMIVRTTSDWRIVNSDVG